MDIDEARRDREALRIDDLLRLAGDAADLGDASVRNGDIDLDRRLARAVDTPCRRG